MNTMSQNRWPTFRRPARLTRLIPAILLSGAIFSTGCQTFQTTRQLTYIGEHGKSITMSETTGVLSTDTSHMVASYESRDAEGGFLKIELGSEAVTTTENQATTFKSAIEAARYLGAAAIGYIMRGGI